MKKLSFALFLLSSLFLITCQKETSYETGGVPSHGSLQDDGSGDCLPKTVNGVYEAGTALTATNTIQVSVNVTKTGSYTILSDTVNGYYFKASGIFSTLGMNSVSLKGSGTPAASGINNFLIKYDSSACNVAVTVLPAGSGGPASFTIQSSGTPAVCSGTPPTGTYIVGTALTSSNTVTFNVDVTTIGTYTVTSDTVNGMYFNATGTFAATGSQTLLLTGNGTPTGTAGTVTLHVTAGSSTCSFSVTTTTGATFSFNCATLVVNGTYQAGVALNPTTNTVNVTVNVLTVGPYNISVTSGGMTFSASGTFTVATATPITLVGSGTPSTAGTFDFTLPGSPPACTFQVTVTAAAAVDYFPRTTNSNWSYEFDDVSSDSLLVNVISNTLSALGNTYNIFMQNDGTAIDTSGYFRKSGNDYYRYTNLLDYFGFDNDQWVEFNFIKDNQAASFTWTTPGYTGSIGGQPITLRIKFTILQKDVPISVTTSTGMVSYPNTIVVQEQYEALVGSTWTSLDTVFGYFKDYYSRNVGWIVDEYYDASGTLANKMEMRRYIVY